jgi:hypothetical protein
MEARKQQVESSFEVNTSEKRQK